MKLSVEAVTLTGTIFWGVCFLFVSISNYLWPPYGKAFLDLMSSVYPGYRAAGTVGSIINGTLYAFMAGGLGGFLLASIYNASC